MNTPAVKIILLGRDATHTYWRIGHDVFTSPGNGERIDEYGRPSGSRWRCTLREWEKMRKTVFGNVKDASP